MFSFFYKDPIYFIHIPKTAGTSLRRMLQRYYGIKSIFPNDDVLINQFAQEYPDEKWLLDNKNKLPRYKALFLHWPVYFKNELPQKHRTAVFVRDPLQRTLSVLADGAFRFKRTIDDLLNDQKYVNDYIKDIQTRFLGAKNEKEFMGSDGIDLLAPALSQLDDLDFIGITDSFHESCILFDKTFGTKISMLQMKENVLRSNLTDLMEYAEHVQPLIERDNLLYEKIKCHFLMRTHNAPK